MKNVFGLFVILRNYDRMKNGMKTSITIKVSIELGEGEICLIMKN